MKIYTLTFSCTTNVGAALQEYALYKYLENNGHEVKVVDYIPLVMRDEHSLAKKIFKRQQVGSFIKNLILLPLDISRKRKFKKFSRHFISMTSTCNSAMQIEQLPQPDLYICGSDQIWNSQFIGLDDGFFLNFNTKASKVSYAASIGRDYIDQEEVKKISDKINSFKLISVRERYLKEVLNKNGLNNVQHVLDPVFLLDRYAYENIATDSKYKNYVLLYEAEINVECYLVAKKIAEKYNLKVVQINRVKKSYPVDYVVPNPSPSEFLGLVKSANFVVTNSFHGTALSIILEKQFYIIKLKHLFSRIESVLEKFNLTDRIIENSKDLSEIDLINYNEYKEIFNSNVSHSKKFLSRATDETS